MTIKIQKYTFMYLHFDGRASLLISLTSFYALNLLMIPSNNIYDSIYNELPKPDYTKENRF